MTVDIEGLLKGQKIDAESFRELGAAPGRLADIVNESIDRGSSYLEDGRWRETVSLMVRSLAHVRHKAEGLLDQDRLLEALTMVNGLLGLQSIVSATLALIESSGYASREEINLHVSESFDICRSEISAFGRVLGFENPS